MEYHRGHPLLTVNEVRRMAQVAHRTSLTATSRYRADEASWSGFLHMHNRRRDADWLMSATLNATGNDRTYTSDRAVEAIFSFYRTRGKPAYQMEYRVTESPKGIAYAILRFTGQWHDRVLDHQPTFTFPYKEERTDPKQSTSADQLVWNQTRENIQRFMLNEDITGGLLKAAGVTQ